MPSSLTQRLPQRHPVLPDMDRPRMAKADVQKLDIDWMREVGTAITRAIAMTGWSLKETAAKIQVDPAELGKWCSGDRRPQFDKLFAIEELRKPLVVSLSRLTPNVEVEMQIRWRA